MIDGLEVRCEGLIIRGGLAMGARMGGVAGVRGDLSSCGELAAAVCRDFCELPTHADGGVWGMC